MKRVVCAVFVGICGSALALTPKQQSIEKIRQIEREKGIEPGLLEAIAQIESKLNPYVVNACGRGYQFKSAAEAAKFVKQKQNQGYRNISVGVMQLHVPSHHHHFASLEQMCEIENNVAYGAKLLKRLKKRNGSNEAAVKLYHSPNPRANEPYKSRVFGAWARIKLSRNEGAVPVNAVMTAETGEKSSDKKLSNKKSKQAKIRPAFSPGGLVRKK
jgi:soluble lytic murein transglycosylase-like protein